MANLTRAQLIKSRMVKGDLIKSTLVRFADSTRTSIEVREVPLADLTCSKFGIGSSFARSQNRDGLSHADYRNIQIQ
jgi:hypothetical protein